MSSVKTTAVQLGDSGTASQNAVLKTNLDGSFTLARGNLGATTQDLFTIDASGNVLFPADTNLLGKSFVSAEQTITAAGALTIPHGLGASPSLLQARLICKTAQNNYSIGDEIIIQIGSEADATAESYGVSIWPDATNLNLIFGSNATVFHILNKTTGAKGGITPANWKLIVRAWK